ncbi:MAG: hypothetical protein Kow0042_16330 [Calditrichia bacterium]
MKIYTTCLFTLLLAAFGLQAQNPVDKDSKYVNFEIDRTPFLSGGLFIQKNLALEAGVGLALNDEIGSNGLAMRLAMEKYLSDKRLTPILGGLVRFDINPDALQLTGWEGSRLILGGYWGLNYFITSQLAAAVGLGADLQLNSPKNRDSSINFFTFTSGIKFKFFF